MRFDEQQVAAAIHGAFEGAPEPIRQGHEADGGSADVGEADFLEEFLRLHDRESADVAGDAGESGVGDGHAFGHLLAGVEAEGIAHIPAAAAHECEGRVAHHHGAGVEEAGEVFRSDEGRAAGFEDAEDFGGEEARVVQVLDDLGAVNDFEAVVFIGPDPVEVDGAHLNAAGFGLLLQFGRGFDAAEKLGLVVEVFEKERAIGAADVEQALRAQTCDTLPAPIVAPLATPEVGAANHVLKRFDHLLASRAGGKR